jgi:hypothetical protein
LKMSMMHLSYTRDYIWARRLAGARVQLGESLRNRISAAALILCVKIFILKL